MLSRLDEQTLVGGKHVARQQLPDLPEPVDQMDHDLVRGAAGTNRRDRIRIIRGHGSGISSGRAHPGRCRDAR